MTAIFFFTKHMINSPQSERVQDQNGHQSEDKDTQTERQCSTSNGAVSNTCTNALTNITCTDVTCTEVTRNVTCNVTCSIPSSSRQSVAMETDDRLDEMEANSVLLSKHNPLLSNSSSVVEDLTSLLDPIHTCNVRLKRGFFNPRIYSLWILWFIYLFFWVNRFSIEDFSKWKYRNFKNLFEFQNFSFTMF